MRSLLPYSPLVALFAVIVAACGGSQASTPPPSSSPITLATAPLPPAFSPTAPTTATTGPGDPHFSGDRAKQHVVALAETIGVRATGTDGERRAADYIAAQFRSYGYDVSEQPFTFDGFVDLGSSLRDGAGHTYETSSLAYSAAGDVTAAAVVAGIGRPEDFSAGTAGKIAVIKRGELTFTDKVTNAQAAGAVAVVIYNDSPGPFRGTLRGQASIPAVSISGQDGDALLAALGAGALTVHVDARTGAIDSQNVVARPAGGECDIIAGGHYDSVPAGPGANDNASGTAVVIELARTLAAEGRHDVCFAAFGGEELGLHGSQAFVASLSPDDLRPLKAMLNFDMEGVGNTWNLIGDPSMVDLGRSVATRLGIAAVPSQLPAGAGSDHASFEAAGVPVLFFYRSDDPNYHTANDRARFVDPTALDQSGEMGDSVIAQLLGAP